MNEFRCRCLWNRGRCPNAATQEDGLCDWCGDRRPDQLRDNPKAIFDPRTAEYLGLGGGGDPPEAHQRFDGEPPTACWMPNSGRMLAHE